MPLTVPVEDQLEVQDILGRYCWYMDENRGPEWAALFTEDGVFEGTRPEPVVGREALTAAPDQTWSRFQGGLRHLYSNLYLERGTNENELIARYYNQVTLWDDGAKPIMLALSTVTLVRADADAPWLIKRNSIKVLK